jgi:hypothetical protein
MKAIEKLARSNKKKDWTFKLRMEDLTEMETCVEVFEKATNALRIKYVSSHDEKYRTLYEELLSLEESDEEAAKVVVNSFCKEHNEEYQMVMFRLGMGRLKYDYWDWANATKYVSRLQEAYDRVNDGDETPFL